MVLALLLSLVPLAALEAVGASPAGADPSCPCSLWSGSTTPTVTDFDDPQAVELGVQFSSTVSGYVTGVRFYKGAGNTGEHIGSLWTTAGTLLAQATFVAESSTGWQQVAFSTPVAVVAGTTYVASYHTNTGHYAVDSGYFADHGYSNAPLSAPGGDTATPNGLFAYSPTPTFPTGSFNGNNYWVDVTFSAQPTPVSISVGAVQGSMPKGTSQPLTATETFSDGSTKDVTSTATWTSSNPSVGTVSPAGVLSGTATGSTTVTATIDGISGQTTVSVVASVAYLMVNPAISTLSSGQTRQLTRHGPAHRRVVADGDPPGQVGHPVRLRRHHDQLHRAGHRRSLRHQRVHRLARTGHGLRLGASSFPAVSGSQRRQSPADLERGPRWPALTWAAVDTAAFDYDLPEARIAQHPVEPRDAARLLVDAARPGAEHRHVRDLPDLLDPGDLLVVNNTRVLPARLRLREGRPGERSRCCCSSSAAPTDAGRRSCGPAAGCRPGTRAAPPGDGADLLSVEVGEDLGDGRAAGRARGTRRPGATCSTASRPPARCRCRPTSTSRSPTPSATRPSTPAARRPVGGRPTAGLHLTPELLDRLADRGVARRRRSSCIVGLGTFRPIERRARSRTTGCTRALPGARGDLGRVPRDPRPRAAGSWPSAPPRCGRSRARPLTGELEGHTELFIHGGFDVPGRRPAADQLPPAPLVAAGADRRLRRPPLARPLRRRRWPSDYRFLSFGDAMLLTRHDRRGDR